MTSFGAAERIGRLELIIEWVTPAAGPSPNEIPLVGDLLSTFLFGPLGLLDRDTRHANAGHKQLNKISTEETRKSDRKKACSAGHVTEGRRAS